MNQYDPPRRTMRPVGTTIDGGDRNGHMGTNSCQAIRTVTSWRRGQVARGGRGARADGGERPPVPGDAGATAAPGPGRRGHRGRGDGPAGPLNFGTLDFVSKPLDLEQFRLTLDMIEMTSINRRLERVDLALDGQFQV
jgi:hypothetical protein